MDVQISSPGNQSRIDGDKTTVRFSVASDKPVIEARIYLDGTVVKIFTDSNYIYDIDLTTGNRNLRVWAKNSDGKEVSKSIDFAVNQDWISPTPSITTTPTATPTPTKKP